MATGAGAPTPPKAYLLSPPAQVPASAFSEHNRGPHADIGAGPFGENR
jgi:hypothetical protein